MPGCVKKINVCFDFESKTGDRLQFDHRNMPQLETGHARRQLTGGWPRATAGGRWSRPVGRRAAGRLSPEAAGRVAGILPSAANGRQQAPPWRTSPAAQARRVWKARRGEYGPQQHLDWDPFATKNLICRDTN